MIAMLMQKHDYLRFSLEPLDEKANLYVNIFT